MQELARQVEARAERLAELSLVGMDEDPFWSARYGEEQARHLSEDARNHVRQLVKALEVGKPEEMKRYARGLRSERLAKGMCSRHIARQFQGLREALHREGLDTGEGVLAHATLYAAEVALGWPEGPARALQQADVAVVMDALARLPPEDTVPGKERLTEELFLLLSYLTDAVGEGKAERFMEHVRWYAGFWPRRSLRCTWPEVLAAVDAALAAEPIVSGEPRRVLAAGRAALQAQA
jgi:hypothetical protein